jgi:uncharacterized protein
MDVTPLLSKGILPLTGYGPGYFSFPTKQRADHSILLTPNGFTNWSYDSSRPLTLEDFDILHSLPYKPQLILVGTGTKAIRLPASLFALLQQRYGSVELMTTPACCRTYSVLLTEGRDVAALLTVMPLITATSSEL